MNTPPPPSVLRARKAARLSRTERLAGVFARAGLRLVYGIDCRGHGGAFNLDDKKTDLWCVLVEDLTHVCIAGLPWERLPEVPT